MSNRAVREFVVDHGREARVRGYDPLLMRAFWFPEGIGRVALKNAGYDRRSLEPEERRTAAQWLAYLRKQIE